MSEMNHTTNPPRTKRCSKCGIEKPSDCFSKDKTHKDGLSSRCKLCSSEAGRLWREANPERHAENGRRWRAVNSEQHRENARRWYYANHERAKETRRRWREINPEHASDLGRRWQQANREKVNAATRRWRLANPERSKARVRRWLQANPEKRRVYGHNRSARERSLPDSFTHEQWLHALDYFHGCCAVCGRQVRDLFGTHRLAADHWIPLNSLNCPGTIVGNMIPLCHGEGGCNNQKNDRDAETWLIEKFGKRKAAEILKRINEYFTSLKQETNET